MYSTSVGGGPFPTELLDSDGERLRTIELNMEQQQVALDVVDGFDAVAASFSCWVNGFTSLAVTKLDILDSFETLKYVQDIQLMEKW